MPERSARRNTGRSLLLSHTAGDACTEGQAYLVDPWLRQGWAPGLLPGDSMDLGLGCWTGDPLSLASLMPGRAAGLLARADNGPPPPAPQLRVIPCPQIPCPIS